jgi:hypothetical protein
MGMKLVPADAIVIEHAKPASPTDRTLTPAQLARLQLMNPEQSPSYGFAYAGPLSDDAFDPEPP